MSLKILGLFVVAVGLILFFSWHRDMRSSPPEGISIETVGLDDLNIHLEAPYGSLSPYHALIVNDSAHHLLACDVVFEAVTEDGRVLSSRRVIAYGDLIKASSEARQRLLKLQPGIAPHSKMLLGLGVEPDLVRVFGNQLPPLGDPNVVTILRSSTKIERLIIKLNAVVIESGEALGPTGQTFLTHLQEEVLKE